jgi:uncharacterized membrane protein
MNTPTASQTKRLERIIGIVLRAGVTASSLSLTLGLILLLAGMTAAPLFLTIGIVVLLATPIVRVAVSVVEYTVERDWTFTLLTLIVLGELAAGVVAAFYGRKL